MGASTQRQTTGAGNGARSLLPHAHVRFPGSSSARRVCAMLLIFLPIASPLLAPGQMAVAQRASKSASPETERQIDFFARVVSIVRDRHVSKPNAPDLIEKALNGLVEGIDPDAELLPLGASPSRTGDEPAAIDLGLVLRRDGKGRQPRTGGIRIVATLDDSPAARAGLKSNDLITSIEGEAASGMSVRDALLRLDRGSGTRFAVRLEVRRETEQAFKVALVRENLNRAVTAYKLSSGAIHLKISRFTPGTAREMLAALQQAGFAASAGAGIGIVLDLRNAAAGSIEEAAAAADEFLAAGPILLARTRQHPNEVMTSASGRGNLRDARLVVLIDAGTSMAGEVLAAALQGNGRGHLVGGRSHGRAFSRSQLRIVGSRRDERVVLVPTKRYLTPAGAEIHGKGLQADHAVEHAPIEATCRSTDIRESGDTPCRARLPEEDRQLLRAISLLEQAPPTQPK